MKMKNALTELTSQLVRIPSTHPQEAPLADHLQDYFKKKGCIVSTQKVDGKRYNLIVEKHGKSSNKKKKSLIFYAHLDTVAPADGWSKGRSPHKPVLVGDKLYGLGTYDMKGGMAVNIKAFEDTETNNIDLKLVFCVDEEYISEGGHALVDTKYMKNTACIISPEPAFLYGVNGITTGRMGRSVFDLVLTRESIHTAFYDPKDDLNRVLSEVIHALENLYHLEAGKKQFLFFRTLESEVNGMSLPSKIHVTIEASLIPPHTVQSIEKTLHTNIKAILKKFDKKIAYTLGPVKRKTPFLNPYEIDQDNPYAKILAQSVKHVTHKKAHMYFRSSVADDNIFGAKGYTVLGIGPEGDHAHAPDEWVSISSLEKLYEIFTDFINNCDSVI